MSAIVGGRRGLFLLLSIGVTLGFNGWFLSWLLLRPGSIDQFTTVDNLAQTAGYLLGAAFCLVGLHFSPRTPGGFSTQARADWPLVPFLFSASLVLSGIAQGVWTYYQQALQQTPPSPSWADAFFLSAYPFQLLGILLLPTQRLTGLARSRVMLDGLIMMTAVGTLSWYFLVGPTMQQGQGTLLATVVGASYPFLDLVTVFCLILLVSRTMRAALRPGISLLLCALTMVVIIDAIYDYQTLQNTYVTGGLLDLGWPVGDMLIGLAIQLLNLSHAWPGAQFYRSPAQAHDESASLPGSSLGLAFLLYLFLIPSVLLLAISIWHTGQNGVLAQGVYLGITALFGLILLRQVLAMRQSLFNNRALDNANRQLQQQAGQLQAAYEKERQLNEVKDQFILNVNHELRTPLTQIAGYLNLLSDYHGQLEPGMQETFIAHALQGCEDLLSLVNTILDAARGGSQEQLPPAFSAISLAAAVSDALALFGPLEQRTHTIVAEIPEGLIVRADRNYLHRILVNLISNALKYSPAQTSVLISAGQFLPVPLAVVGRQETCLCVQDAGQGIPPAEIPLLFGKFVRLQRDLGGPIRGTGLGLYLCKQLAEAMGGRMWVESEGVAGQGSRFYLTLLSLPQPGLPLPSGSSADPLQSFSQV